MGCFLQATTGKAKLMLYMLYIRTDTESLATVKPAMLPTDVR